MSYRIVAPPKRGAALVLVGASLVAAWSSAGCRAASSESCEPGAEGCPCAADGLCASGLACASDLCVSLSGSATDGDDAPTDDVPGDDDRGDRDPGDDETGDNSPGDGAGDEGPGGDDETGSEAGETADEIEPDAPVIISLAANVSVVTPSQSITVSAIVSDPDGIEDVIGGQLRTGEGGTVLGAFGAAAEEGAYSLTLSFADLGAAEPLALGRGAVERELWAEFFDQAGASTGQALDYAMDCDAPGELLCDQTCVSAECHPTELPCPGGEVCLGGECFAGPIGDVPGGENCFVEEPLACEHFCTFSMEVPLSCGTTLCCSGPLCDPAADDCPGGLTCTTLPWLGEGCEQGNLSLCL